MATKRRKREPVTRERALAGAMALADAGGIGDLTMRRLAEELGVEAMSLYHHVPSKDAILDGMIDLVWGEIAMPRRDVDWKTAIRERTASVRAVLLRHPWAIRLMESRRAPGPVTLAHHDAMLGVFRGAGFSIALTAHAYALVDAFTYGFVHTELNLPFQSGPETQAVAGEIFSKIPAGALPHLVELAKEHVLKPGYAYADELAFGLELILEGLERAKAADVSRAHPDAVPRRGRRS
jgi:AcrR family transcriptional regulator